MVGMSGCTLVALAVIAPSKHISHEDDEVLKAALTVDLVVLGAIACIAAGASEMGSGSGGQ